MVLITSIGRRERELAHHVEARPSQQRVEMVRGKRADQRFERLDPAGREHLRDQFAVARVARRVHVDHQPTVWLGASMYSRLVPHDDEYVAASRNAS